MTPTSIMHDCNNGLFFPQVTGRAVYSTLDQDTPSPVYERINPGGSSVVSLCHLKMKDLLYLTFIIS